ncbi:unnamed protein product, partial [Urochloa humidicola]
MEVEAGILIHSPTKYSYIMAVISLCLEKFCILYLNYDYVFITEPAEILCHFYD